MTERRTGTAILARIGLAAISAMMALSAGLSTVSAEPANKGFDFVAFGDMPYRTPGDFRRLKDLIDAINVENPAFTVHVGDIKNGIRNCSTDYYRTILDYFNSFTGALIYTPGDNDWSDCDRFLAGAYDTRERLGELRRLFFSGPESLGHRPIPQQRQADLGEYPSMVENAIWSHEGITFATIHMVGTDNNLGDDPEEFETRNGANIAWINYAFQQAAALGHAGVVLLFHADIFSRAAPRRSFEDAVKTIAIGADAFGRPVLLVNGDAHRFGVDHPIRHRDSGKVNENVTRIVVFGGERMRAVRITVTPGSAQMFTATPLKPKGD